MEAQSFHQNNCDIAVMKSYFSWQDAEFGTDLGKHRPGPRKTRIQTYVTNQGRNPLSLKAQAQWLKIGA
jgi:hypothetical protein